MRNFASLSLGRFISAASQSVLVLIVAATTSREISAVVLGSLAISVTLSAVIDSGIGTAMIYEYSQGRERNAVILFRRGTGLQILFALATSFIFGVSASGVDPALGLFGSLIGPWAALERVIENGNLIDVAKGNAVRVGLQLASRRFIALLVSLALMPALGIEISMILGLCFGSVLAFLFTFKPRLIHRGDSHQTFGATLKLLLPYAFSSWSNQIRNLDLPLATGVVGFDAAYNLGLRVASPLSIPFNSLGNLILAKKVNRLSATATLNLYFSVLASGLLIFLTAAFLGDIYQILSRLVAWVTVSDIWIMSLVIVRIVFAGCSSVQSSLLNSGGFANSVSKINSAASLISLVGVGVFSLFFHSIMALVIWPICVFIAQVLFVQLVFAKKWDHGTF